MNGRVAARRPAIAKRQKIRVIDVANVYVTGRRLRLRMAPQAETVIVFDEHVPVDRTMRVVANCTAFAHRLMFEDKRAGLRAMALDATLVLPGHRQPTGGLENILAVRVVALHATHVALQDRMVVG